MKIILSLNHIYGGYCLKLFISWMIPCPFSWHAFVSFLFLSSSVLLQILVRIWAIGMAAGNFPFISDFLIHSPFRAAVVPFFMERNTKRFVSKSSSLSLISRFFCSWILVWFRDDSKTASRFLKIYLSLL